MLIYDILPKYLQFKYFDSIIFRILCRYNICNQPKPVSAILQSAVKKKFEGVTTWICGYLLNTELAGSTYMLKKKNELNFKRGPFMSLLASQNAQWGKRRQYNMVQPSRFKHWKESKDTSLSHAPGKSSGRIFFFFYINVEKYDTNKSNLSLKQLAFNRQRSWYILPFFLLLLFYTFYLPFNVFILSVKT